MPVDITTTEEKSVIALAFDEPTFFSLIIEHIDINFFMLDETKFIFRIIKFCYDNNGGTIPTREIVRSLAEKHLSVDSDNFKEILDICDYKIDPRDYDFIKDRLLNWLRSRTLDEVYEQRVIEAAKSGNYSELEKIVDKAARIQDLSGDCMWFFQDIDKLFDEHIEEKYTTGFPELDKYINEGGPTKGEVMVWMAPTGHGKCHSLDSKIIVDGLSTIFELEFDNGQTVKIAGYRRIKTNRGIINVCDLSEGDDIIEVFDYEDEGDISL